MPDADATPVSHAGPSRRHSAMWLVLLGIVGLCALAGFVVSGLRMPAHATVGGVDVSRLAPDAAQTKVAEALGERATVPITVVGGGRSFVIQPDRTGLGVDVEASVKAAGGAHSLNPLRWFRLLAGHVEAPLVVESDDEKLDAAVENIARALDKPPVEPLVTFKGTDPVEPVVRKPVSGTVVDRKAAAAAIRSAYLTKDRIDLPVTGAKPTVGQAKLDAAMKNIVEPAISGPVTVLVA